MCCAPWLPAEQHSPGSRPYRLTQRLGITDLPGLLTQGVLGRLDLHTWQALSATSRACRQLLAGAEDVLAVLVLVSETAHRLLVSRGCQDLSCSSMQAKLAGTLPPPHQAPLHQELNAVASQHASVRQGEVAALLEVTPTVPLPSSLSVYRSSLAPTWTAAALFCVHVCAPVCLDSMVMVSKPPGATMWALAPAGTITDKRIARDYGWSASGRFFGCLHRSAHGHPPGVWSAQFFDTTSRSWLPELHLHDSDLLDPVRVVFCEDETLAAVQFSFHRVVICGVQHPTVRVLVVPSNRFPDFEWLPGTTTLLLVDVLGRALAAVPVSAAAEAHQSSVHPDWAVNLGAAAQEATQPRLAILPSGCVLLVHLEHPSPSETSIHFLVYGHDLQRRSTQTFHVAGQGIVQNARLCHDMTISKRSLALPLGSMAMPASVGTWVFELQHPHAIGKLMFEAPGFSQPALSADGHFLAGVHHGALRVLDCRTGACVLQVRPSTSWLGMPAEHPYPAMVTQPTWGRERQNELLISTDVHMGPGPQFGVRSLQHIVCLRAR